MKSGLLHDFPDDRLLGGFSELNPASDRIQVIVPVIANHQKLSVPHNDGTYAN